MKAYFETELGKLYLGDCVGVGGDAEISTPYIETVVTVGNIRWNMNEHYCYHIGVDRIWAAKKPGIIESAK